MAAAVSLSIAKSSWAGKSHRAQHAQRIFAESIIGIAHGPNDLLHDVAKPAQRVDDVAGGDVLRDGVDS